MHQPSVFQQRLDWQPVGSRFRIIGISLPEALQQRLLEMGLTIGAECTVTRYAPLGDPMEINIRGYYLALRATEARGVQVQPIN
jgi:ferrous iron transport protein A